MTLLVFPGFLLAKLHAAAFGGRFPFVVAVGRAGTRPLTRFAFPATARSTPRTPSSARKNAISSFKSAIRASYVARSLRLEHAPNLQRRSSSQCLRDSYHLASSSEFEWLGLELQILDDSVAG